MNDDHPLSDYSEYNFESLQLEALWSFHWISLCLTDVNGKVIHLVQRPPPGSTRGGSSSSNNTDSTTNDRHRNNDSGRNNVPFIHVLDGTVLGAMAIPMNTNSGVSILNHMGLMKFRLWHSNLYNFVKFQDYTIDYTLYEPIINIVYEQNHCGSTHAKLCKQYSQLFGKSWKSKLAYISLPQILGKHFTVTNEIFIFFQGLNNTDMDILAQQTMESTVFEVGISAVSDADVPQQDVQNVVQLFQGAVSAAFQQVWPSIRKFVLLSMIRFHRYPCKIVIFNLFRMGCRI